MRIMIIFLTLAISAPVLGQTNTTWKGSGSHGAVAAGGQGAVDAGIATLKSGGNAVDAAAATILAALEFRDIQRYRSRMRSPACVRTLLRRTCARCEARGMPDGPLRQSSSRSHSLRSGRPPGDVIVAAWGSALRLSEPRAGTLEAAVEHVVPGEGRWDVVLSGDPALRCHLPLSDPPPAPGDVHAIRILRGGAVSRAQIESALTGVGNVAGEGSRR